MKTTSQRSLILFSSNCLKILLINLIKAEGNLMENLLAGGFLFVGGAILMLANEYSNWVPVVGSIIALIGLGMLIYFLFSKNGKYDD